MQGNSLFYVIFSLTGLALLTHALALSAGASVVSMGLGASALIVYQEWFRRHALHNLEEQMQRMQHTISGLRSDLAQQDHVLRQGTQALHEAEERYQMAVSGAEDGLWDWDLRNEQVYYTPRWKTLLGLDSGERIQHIDLWLTRVHPDDRARVEAELDGHLTGQRPQLMCEHRLQHAAGHWLWVLVRGRAIVSASGKPLRLVTLTTDISMRKRAEEILLCLAAGLNSAHGLRFFQGLVFNFAQAFRVRHAFITECLDQQVSRVRTLAYWNGEIFAEPLEYDLRGTPCDTVINQSQTRFYPSGLAYAFARDSGFESYLGIPIFDATQCVIGHLALLDQLPMNDPLPHEPIFKLFSARAGVELELVRLQRALA